MEYIRSVFGSIIGEGGISLYAALTLDVFDDLINRLVGVALELALVEEEAELAAHARRVATRTLKILGIGELASTIASRCSLIAHGIDARRILKTDLIEARVVKVLDLNLDRRALGLAFCGLGALLVLIAVELIRLGRLPVTFSISRMMDPARASKSSSGVTLSVLVSCMMPLFV